MGYVAAGYWSAGYVVYELPATGSSSITLGAVDVSAAAGLSITVTATAALDGVSISAAAGASIASSAAVFVGAISIQASGSATSVYIPAPNPIRTTADRWVPIQTTADRWAPIQTTADRWSITLATSRAYPVAMTTGDRFVALLQSIPRSDTWNNTMALLASFTKQPEEVRLIPVDFSPHLGGRTASAVTVTPTVPAGLTMTDELLSGSNYQIWIGGGTDLQVYTIYFLVTFTIGGHTETIRDKINILVEAG